jgi:hypothetical protein
MELARELSDESAEERNAGEVKWCHSKPGEVFAANSDSEAGPFANWQKKLLDIYEKYRRKGVNVTLHCICSYRHYLCNELQ